MGKENFISALDGCAAMQLWQPHMVASVWSKG